MWWFCLVNFLKDKVTRCFIHVKRKRTWTKEKECSVLNKWIVAFRMKLERRKVEWSDKVDKMIKYDTENNSKLYLVLAWCIFSEMWNYSILIYVRATTNSFYSLLLVLFSRITSDSAEINIHGARYQLKSECAGKVLSSLYSLSLWPPRSCSI